MYLLEYVDRLNDKLLVRNIEKFTERKNYKDMNTVDR